MSNATPAGQPGTEPTIAADENVAKASKHVKDAEPEFKDPNHPTPDERAKWEAWRDAVDAARRLAQAKDEADQGFARTEVRDEINAEQAKSPVGSAAANRSKRTEDLAGHAAHKHVKASDGAKSSEK